MSRETEYNQSVKMYLRIMSGEARQVHVRFLTNNNCEKQLTRKRHQESQTQTKLFYIAVGRTLRDNTVTQDILRNARRGERARSART
jgi:hypothetical protein